MYYEQKAKRKATRESNAAASSAYDDENYDYIVKQKEPFGEGDRYTILEKIGKVRRRGHANVQ